MCAYGSNHSDHQFKLCQYQWRAILQNLILASYPLHGNLFVKYTQARVQYQLKLCRSFPLYGNYYLHPLKFNRTSTIACKIVTQVLTYSSSSSFNHLQNLVSSPGSSLSTRSELVGWAVSTALVARWRWRRQTDEDVAHTDNLLDGTSQKDTKNNSKLSCLVHTRTSSPL